MPRRFACTACGGDVVTFMRVGEVAHCPGCETACEVPASAEPCEDAPAWIPEGRPVAGGDPRREPPPSPPGPCSSANLVTAGLFAVTLVLIPVSLALQFRSLEYTPGGLLTRPVFNLRTWAFVYASVLAVGALRIRARPGEEARFRALLAVVKVQAAMWALAWVLEIALRLADDPYRRLRIAFGSGFFLLGIFSLFAAPVVTGFLLRRSRRGGFLMLGQLLPWLWLVHFMSTWGFVT